MHTTRLSSLRADALLPVASFSRSRLLDVCPNRSTALRAIGHHTAEHGCACAVAVEPAVARAGSADAAEQSGVDCAPAADDAVERNDAGADPRAAEGAGLSRFVAGPVSPG